MALVCAVHPEPSAAAESLSGSAGDAFHWWLLQIEALGPAGPLLFILTVGAAECIPLFPTQPLCLAGGILFGAKLGTLAVLAGCTLAAFTAFNISRGVGRKLAEKLVQEEMGEETKEADSAVSRKLAEVTAAIEDGGPWRQYTAVTALRLTPVIPFSASNYLLGMTPVTQPAYLAGTLTGMSLWATVYANIGSVGRDLIQSGVPVQEALQHVQASLSQYSDKAVGLGVAAIVGFGVYQLTQALPSPRERES